MNIALVEPLIPQNTGNIARSCAVTGASLHLVEPLGFRVDDAKLKRAGLDYWHLLDIHYHPSLKAFLSFADHLPLFFVETCAERSYADVRYPENACVVFGKETSGLPRELLGARPERCVRIPMRPGLRSLNLSNAVAIVLFEALRQQGFPEMS